MFRSVLLGSYPCARSRFRRNGHKLSGALVLEPLEMIVDALGITARFEMDRKCAISVWLFLVKWARVLRVLFERRGFTGPYVAYD